VIKLAPQQRVAIGMYACSDSSPLMERQRLAARRFRPPRRGASERSTVSFDEAPVASGCEPKSRRSSRTVHATRQSAADMVRTGLLEVGGPPGRACTAGRFFLD